MTTSPDDRPSRTGRRSLLALAAVAGLTLAGCGSSSGSDAASTTDAPQATSTTADGTTPTLPVTTTTAPATTTTAVPASDLTPEEVAVGFITALADGTDAGAFVRDPAVTTDAQRQFGEGGIGAYNSIALDPDASMRESGAPDTCAVNDVTLTCFVLIDRNDVEEGAVDTLVEVGVAVNDLGTTTGPEEVGAKVPAHVVSVEIVPA
ncbi:hypothetical protein ACE2AJ_01340 [Aquihabitans daechungensis]|uniref:hypothetical protein n=1 Tax=Aquihabitans daechungensis TaxID=1052257 RepID=UPI003BA038A4